MPDELSCLMSNLPPEILIVVFSFLHRLDLIKCLRVCWKWNNILRSPATWPSFVGVDQFKGTYEVGGVLCRSEVGVKNLCKSLSNLPGTITSLKMNVMDHRYELRSFICCFSSLEQLDIRLGIVTVRQILYVLNNCLSLRVLRLVVVKRLTGDQNITLNGPTALQQLDIGICEPPSGVLAYSLISQSPDLTSVRLDVLDVTEELTSGFGEKLEHLHLTIFGPLPRLSCTNLRVLYFSAIEISTDGDRVDLSSIRCLGIGFRSYSAEREFVKLMRFYNIGRNLECLTVDDATDIDMIGTLYIKAEDILRQAPNLKRLTIPWDLLEASEINQILESYHPLEIFYNDEFLLEEEEDELLQKKVADVTYTHRFRKHDQNTCTDCCKKNLTGAESSGSSAILKLLEETSCMFSSYEVDKLN
jgi:hypothetical protein